MCKNLYVCDFSIHYQHQQTSTSFYGWGRQTGLAQWENHPAGETEGNVSWWSNHCHQLSSVQGPAPKNPGESNTWDLFSLPPSLALCLVCPWSHDADEAILWIFDLKRNSSLYQAQMCLSHYHALHLCPQRLKRKKSISFLLSFK